MEQYLAEKFAREWRIDVTQVVREYWEILILKGLIESSCGMWLIFKGGTALRLVYGSPRFSEDLDFSIKKDTLKGRFKKIMQSIIKPYSELALTNIAEKFYTYLAEVKVSENYLPLPFRIKIEISKRQERNYLTELRLINSQVSPVQVLCNVATLKQIYKDKLKCIIDRTASKDLFDLWFVSQKLKIPYPRPKTKIPKSILRRDLRKYLPKNYWNVIEGL